MNAIEQACTARGHARDTRAALVLQYALAAVVLTAAASAQDVQSSAPSIEERLRAQEVELAALRSSMVEGAGRPQAGYDGGFYIQSADGELRFTLEGLLQVRGTFFESGLAGRESQFDIERMRFEFGGDFYRLYHFHVEPNFTEDEVELEEAWVGADLALDGPRLMFGRMKEPFSLEEMLPTKHIDFATRSILNQFVPSEDHGVTLFGGSFDGPVEYGAAVYNGTGGDDLNSDKDVAGRLVLRPWAESTGSALQRLQFGGAATWGRTDQDISGDELLTEAQVPFMQFEPGSRFDGDRLRLGLESAWLLGPLALSAEAMRIEEDVRGDGDGFNSTLDGWYVAASYVLTGETKTFDGVQPAHPLLGSAAGVVGRGAWQLAARFSELDLDDGLVDAGLVAPSAFPGSVQTLDVGLNWYTTTHTKVMLHGIHTEYESDITIDGDRRGSENALLLQFQLQF